MCLVLNFTILPVSVLSSFESMSTSCRGPTPLSLAVEISWSEEDRSCPPCPPCCPLTKVISWLLSIELCLFKLKWLFDPELLCSDPQKSLCLLWELRTEEGKEASDKHYVTVISTSNDTDHSPCQTASFLLSCCLRVASLPQPLPTQPPVWPACTLQHWTCAESKYWSVLSLISISFIFLMIFLHL